MQRYGLWIAFGIFLGLLGVGAVVLTRPYAFRGSRIEPPVPATDFTLNQADGSSFTLSEQRGKLTLIFFGYTTCPDVCPATLSEMKQIRERLGADAERVSFVFVTVDPERDTPERMGQYVAAYDPAIHGLTGSEAELEPVYKAFGVYRAKQEVNSSVGYLVDHTSRVYLVDQQGNLSVTYSFGTPVNDMLLDVRHLLKNT